MKAVFSRRARVLGVRPRSQRRVAGWKQPNGGRCLHLAAFVLVSFVFGSIAMSAEVHAATNQPPDFLHNKPRLPDELLKDKREGRYMTGFPAIGWDPETELGYGVVVEGFDNGARDSPFFDLTPYRSKFSIGVNATTGGFRQAGVDYDLPYFK